MNEQKYTKGNETPIAAWYDGEIVARFRYSGDAARFCIDHGEPCVLRYRNREVWRQTADFARLHPPTQHHVATTIAERCIMEGRRTQANT